MPPLEDLRAAGATKLGIPAESIPRHIAVIMDGNGRWAVQRGMKRLEGHRAGAEAVRRTITECGRLGVEVLTLYSFSQENWTRPADEVGGLMGLAHEHLISERSELLKNNVRFLQIGRRDRLPPDVVRELEQTIEATAGCTGLTVVLALNYGSRAEITDAVKSIAEDVTAGSLRVEDINEETVAAHLYTDGLPDPDLLIRTAGEYRLSNYLLWQCSYSEIYVTQTLWPDFAEGDLHQAIVDYARRSRRFGGVVDTPE